jgi:hypothetical protein
MILKYILTQDTLDWVSAIPMLIKNYNDTPISFVVGWKTPDEIYENEDLQRQIIDKAEEYNNKIRKEQFLDIGDRVRVLKPKNKLEKEKQYFSKQIYVIVERVGNRYRISNRDTQEILQRVFKFYELYKKKQRR